MYSRLWLRAFILLCKRDGLKAAIYIMRHRRERNIKELKEFIYLLQTMDTLEINHE